MLASSEHGSKPWLSRQLRHTLLVTAVVIAVSALGAFILYLGTEGLFLVAHQVP